MRKTVAVKKCNSCKEIKSKRQFYKDSRVKSGRKGRCKDCISTFEKIARAKKRKALGEVFCENPDCKKRFFQKRPSSKYCSRACIKKMSYEKFYIKIDKLPKYKMPRWSEQEAYSLRLYREAYKMEFKDISEKLKGRTPKACQKKYLQIKKEEISHEKLAGEAREYFKLKEKEIV